MVPALARKVFVKNKLNDNVTIKIKYMCRKKFAGVKFLDGNRTADESIYFKKEDEALLKNLLKNNPDLNPEFNFTDAESGINSLSNDLCMVFSKHGIKGLNNSEAIRDVIKVFELNGYRKVLDQ